MMTDKKIEIFCENNKQRKFFPKGTNLHQIYAAFGELLPHPTLGAMVNNELKELSFDVYKPKTIRFIDITDIDGMRMYVRSLSFVLLKAAKELFPAAVLTIEHSVSNGYYCEIENLKTELNDEIVKKITAQMQQIVRADIPFVRKEVRTEDAIEIFKQNNFTEKAKLFESRQTLYTSVYYLDKQADYFYGHLLPSTGYLKVFGLVKYYDGMLLMRPNRTQPHKLEKLIMQEKMFDIFREYKSWGEILKIGTIGNINQKVEQNQAGELIKIAEALHEKKIAQIADLISKERQKKRIVLISGPSSSGKTSFSKRLSIQLKINGLKPVGLSLDNYFVNREDTPLDAQGDYDFEALEAIDIQLFNKHLIQLLNGEEIELPKFSFAEGRKKYDGTTLKIDSQNIILIEGIHALNPKLTSQIDKTLKYKIYVSALTQMGIDGHNRIPTTNNRLIRRMIRDNKYRNNSALSTLRRWGSVRRGEQKNIFPFQEEADVMFNSALVFELGVLKRYAEPLLKEVQKNQPEYAEALRLLKFLSYFLPIPDTEIPPTSILREFLGGSSFSY